MANEIRYQVGFDVKQGDLSKLKSSLQQLQKLKISDVMKINDTNAITATTMLNKIKTQAINVENALKSAFNAKLNTVNIQSFNKSLKSSGTTIQQVYKAFSSAGTSGENAFRSLSSQVLNTNIQLKETHNLLDKMAKTLTNTVKWNIASGAINSMSRAVEQAWGYTKALDTSLNNIRIVTGKSAEEMGNFAIKANEAAQGLGKTTTDYTNAALIYAQQGLSDKEIEERARITLMTANVTGQSASDVSEELTAVWNGYKVNAKEAEVYIDRLAAVAATTASDLEELSTGMSKVASAAAAMGVGEDQLAAQLATIISVTRQAPESVGTALRTVYARISDIKAGIDEDGVTLGNYSGKMAELGFNVLDAAGNLRDMGEVMEDIGNRWQDLTREQQISLAQTMAGQRQYSNLIALFDNFEKYNEALDTARNAAGTLQEQQDIYMESIAAHLQTLKAAVENIYDSLADTDSINSINSIADGLAIAANLTANLVDSLGGGVSVLKMIGAVGLNVFSQQIAKGINTTITNFEIAKDNARQFEQALQTTQQWQGIPGLDEVTQKLLNNREQLLSLANMMSPQQFTGMQTMLNQLTDTANAFASLSTQQEILNGIVQSVTKATDKWEGLNSVMRDTDSQAIVLDRIAKQQLAFKELSEALDKYKNDLKELGNKAVNGQQITSDLQTMKASLNTYMDKVKQLAEQGKMQRHVQQVNKLSQALKELPNNLPDNELRTSLLSISSMLQGMTKNAGDAAAQMGEKLKDNFQSTAADISTLVDQMKRKMQADSNQFDIGIERTQRGVDIENYTKIAGSLTSIGIAIQQIQNLGSIWKNQDLSLDEKLLQTIINLGFTLSSIIRAYQTLDKIIISYNANSAIAVAREQAETAAKVAKTAAIQAETAARNANQAAILQEKMMTLALAGASQEEINAVGAQIVALIGLQTVQEAQAGAAALAANAEKLHAAALQLSRKAMLKFIATIAPFAIAIAAIGGAIAIYDKLHLSVKQADKAIEESAQAYSQAQNELKQLQSELKTTEDRIKELQSAGSLTLVQQEELQKLKNVKEELKIQLDIQKQITNEKLKQNAKDIQNKVSNTNAYKQNDKVNYMGLDIVQQQALQNVVKQAGIIDDFLNINIADLKTLIDLEKYFKENKDNIIKDNDLNQDKNYSDYDTIFGVIKTLQERSFEQIKAWYPEAFQNLHTLQEAGLGDSVEANFYKDLIYKYYLGSGKIDSTVGQILKETGKVNDEVFKGIQEQLKATEITDDTAETILSSLFEGFTAERIKNALNVKGLSIADFLNTIKFTSLNWQDYLKAAQANEDISIIQEGLLRLGQTISGLQKVAKGTKLSKKELQELKAELNEISVLYPELMANYKNLFNTELAGTRQYQNELSKLKISLQQLYSKQMSTGEISRETGSKRIIDTIDSAKELYQLSTLAFKVHNPGSSFQGDIAISAIKMEDYRQKVQQLASQYDSCTAALNRYLQVSKTQNQEQQKAALNQLQMVTYAAELAQEYGIDEQRVVDLTESQAKLNDNLELTGKQIADNAVYNIRLNDALIDLKTNYKDYSEILKLLKNNQENEIDLNSNLSKSFKSLKKDFSAIVGLAQDYVDDDWIKKYADDLNSIIKNNDLDALNNIRKDISVDIAANFNIDQSEYQEFLNKLDGLELGQIEDTAFIDSLAQALYDAGATIDDIKNVLSLNNISFDAIDVTPVESSMAEATNFIERATDVIKAKTAEAGAATAENLSTSIETTTDTTKATDSMQAPGTDVEMIDVPGDIEIPSLQNATLPPFNIPQFGENIHRTIHYPKIQVGPAKTDPIETEKVQTAMAVKVINPNKTSGGNISHKTRNTNVGGKKGGGGKGGGGKTQTPTKSKAIKPDREAKYHNVNKTISKLGKEYSDLQKKREKTYGKQLQDVLKDELKILEKQIEAEKEKQEIIKKEQEELKKVLELQGAIFDPNTNEITNYEDLILKIEEKRKQLNQKHDAMTKDQQDAFKEQYQKEKERLEELTQLVQRYVTLQDRFTDSLEQQEEYAYKQIQKKIEDFRIEIEVSLNMGQAERKWNEFERNVLNHSNILKESNFDKMFKDIEQGYADVLSYFDVNGQGSIEALTNQLLATQEELDEINSGGESSIYGTDKKRAMEDLQNDLDELMQQMQDIESLIDNIDQAYLDTIDDISEQFDKQIDNYGLIGDLIEHDIDLLSLLYGDKNYEAMDKYYTTLHNNNLKQLDSLKRQRDFWKEQWDAAVARGDSEAAKQFEEHYKETIGNLNSLIEESAENLRNKYINAIDSIFDDLDKKISGGLGTNYLETSWDLMKKNADEYLDTINSAFAVQDLENKFQKAIDDTKVLKNQQALKKLMDQQLNNLKAKEKLTEYDVQRAEKLLQIEQARIALEDAQASKTSMRLKRDAQGNYSYEYVADESNISEAEQGLATAQNDLYNFDKDRYNSNLEDILGAWKDFQEQYKDIMTDSSLSEDQRVANSALLREQYGQYINNKTAENLVIRNNLQESAFADIAALYRTDVDNYKQMSTDEQNILMNELVPTWESGIQQMTDRVAGQGGFIPVCQGAFEDINQATLDYQNQLDEMANVAGIDLQNVKGGVDDLAISFGDLITKNEDLITTMGNELTAVEQLKNAAHALMEEYNGVYNAAKDAVSVIHEAMQENKSDVFDDRDYDNEDDDNETYAEQITGKKYPTVFDFQKLKESGQYNSNQNTILDDTPGYVSEDYLKGKTLYTHPFAEEEEIKQIEDFSSEWFDELERQGHIVTGTKKYTTDDGQTVNIPDNIWNLVPGGDSSDIEDILDWEKLFARLDTGGYTGDWSGNGGKLAVLHKKELVLNADDTENLFNTMSLLKSITDSLNGDLFARTSGIKSGTYNNLGDSEELEQNVHIDASFPNVNSKREIEEALSDLVNLAAQRAMRR